MSLRNNVRNALAHLHVPLLLAAISLAARLVAGLRAARSRLLHHRRGRGSRPQSARDPSHGKNPVHASRALSALAPNDSTPHHAPPEAAAHGGNAAAAAPAPGFELLLVTWAAAAFSGAVLSPAAYPHYLLPVMPPVLLLAVGALGVVWGASGSWRRLRDVRVLVVAVAVLGAVAPQIGAIWTAARSTWTDRHARWTPAGLALSPTPSQEIGAQIAARTPPDQPIQGFGYRPGVYLAARRPNASRFATTEKLGQVGEAAAGWIRDELWTTLRRDPPAALFFTTAERGWIGPGDARDTWLATHYRLAAVHTGVFVYVRD